MKTIKWILFATMVVALFSCSSTYPETLDEASTLESQTRSQDSHNDSTNGGVNATIKDWVTESADITVTETPNYENEDDSIANDSTKNE